MSTTPRFLGPLVVLATAIAAISPSQPGQSTIRAQPAPADTADVVIDPADGRLGVRRVPVVPDMTGLDLLRGSGVEVVSDKGAVCAIGGVGCPREACFCACQTPDDCRFWAYFHGIGDGSWRPADGGAAEYDVTPGTVDGWVWGPGQTRRPTSAPASLRGVAVGFEWLRARQQRNGSLGDDPGLTADALFAARAAGIDPRDWRTGGQDPLSFLRKRAAAYSAIGPAQTGKLAAAVAAAGEDPHQFGSLDLVDNLRRAYDSQSGRFGVSNWDQAWAMIGLAAAAETVPAQAISRLIGTQGMDGGWGVTADGDADPDSTALALQALVAAGETASSPAVLTGQAYLRVTQQDDGGWQHIAASPTNVNSTALVLQALIATRIDPQLSPWRKTTGASPITFLLDRQRPEGRFEYDTSPADLLATVQVLPALAGQPLPPPGRGVAAGRAARWILDNQNADGSFRSPNPLAGPALTSDAVAALAALGHDPNVRSSGGHTPAEYLAAETPRFIAQGASAAGRLAVGVRALGANPRRFGGVDLPVAIQASFSPSTGAYGRGTTWDNAWAILGLRASGVGSPPQAVEYLIAARVADGGWGVSPQADQPDATSTGLALQALAAANVPAANPAVWLAIEALHGLQRSDGGFPGSDGTTDAIATARAIGGLAAYGHAVEGPGWQPSRPGQMARLSPVEGLMTRQSYDGGFAGVTGINDPTATYAGALGLALRALPVDAARSATRLYLPLLTAR